MTRDDGSGGEDDGDNGEGSGGLRTSSAVKAGATTTEVGASTAIARWAAAAELQTLPDRRNLVTKCEALAR